MIESILIMCGIASIGIGLMLILTNMMPSDFGSSARKSETAINIIAIILIIIGLISLLVGSILQEETLKIEMNDICESIDMEFLKRSTGGLFGNSYVLCYDNINKEIKEIPL